jgi:hypothetical protein
VLCNPAKGIFADFIEPRGLLDLFDRGRVIEGVPAGIHREVLDPTKGVKVSRTFEQNLYSHVNSSAKVLLFAQAVDRAGVLRGVSRELPDPSGWVKLFRALQSDLHTLLNSSAMDLFFEFIEARGFVGLFDREGSGEGSTVSCRTPPEG